MYIQPSNHFLPFWSWLVCFYNSMPLKPVGFGGMQQSMPKNFHVLT